MVAVQAGMMEILTVDLTDNDLAEKKESKLVGGMAAEWVALMDQEMVVLMVVLMVILQVYYLVEQMAEQLGHSWAEMMAEQMVDDMVAWMVGWMVVALAAELVSVAVGLKVGMLVFGEVAQLESALDLQLAENQVSELAFWWVDKMVVRMVFQQDFEKVDPMEFYSVVKMEYLVDYMLVDMLVVLLVDQRENLSEFWSAERKVHAWVVLMADMLEVLLVDQKENSQEFWSAERKVDAWVVLMAALMERNKDVQSGKQQVVRMVDKVLPDQSKTCKLLC